MARMRRGLFAVGFRRVRLAAVMIARHWFPAETERLARAERIAGRAALATERRRATDRVALEADGRRLKEVDEPRLFATAHASPPPFLPELEGLDWRLAQRLAPYRARRKRRDEGTQERLLPASSSGG
jgi:hypothetical protein